MGDKRAVADARRFFRKMAFLSWGYLARKRSQQEETAREKAIKEARWKYWQGIGSAWSTYSKDNPIVERAQETLDKAIAQATKLYLSEDPNHSPKLFLKTILQAHDEHAEKVASIWKAFVKDMKKWGFN